MDSQYTFTQYGFTLLEISVTITIIAVLSTLSYPHMMTALTNMEAKRIHRELLQHIKVAKATSFSHRQHVFMCLVDEQGNCNPNGQESVLLFLDLNNNNKYDVSSDTIVETRDLDLAYAKLSLRAAARRAYVRFASDSGAPRGFMGHFKYCPSTDYNKNKYQLSFNMVGGIKFKPDSAKTPTNC